MLVRRRGRTGSSGLDRGAVDAVRGAALPLAWDRGFPDVGPLVELLGDADVIGLGEPTHGDVESIRLKHAVVRALAQRRRRTLVAWERGVGNMELVALAVKDGAFEQGRRWLYPWVYDEVEDFMRWIRDANRLQTDAVAVGGVDMDGPPPEPVLDRLIATGGPAITEPLQAIRDAAVPTSGAPDDADWYRAVLAPFDQLLTSNVFCDVDRLLLVATAQWLDSELLVREASQEGSASAAFRDRCMADNVVEQWRIHEPDVTVVWAHNGHVSLDPGKSGWHLARSSLSYASVGVAFGAGTFDAGTSLPAGDFDPRLKVHKAETPPHDAVEHVLGQVGLGCFAVDVRHFRGTDHPFGSERVLREVGLAGGRPQFEVANAVAEMYDVLVYLPDIRAATVQRGAKDFW